MKKLITLITVITVILSFSLPAFAAESTDMGQTIESNITTDTLSDLSAATSEAKDDKVLKSDAKSFKGKFASLFAELNILRTECKDLWTQIKATNQAVKAEWKSLREELKGMDKSEAQKILTDLKAKVEPLRTQVKALHTDIKTLREQKKSEWTNFRAAVQARDEASASTALTNIIELKKQIIEKQKVLLPLKQQILETVKA